MVPPVPEKPAVPAVPTKPAAPDATKPAAPDATKPAAPDATKPAAPAKPAKTDDNPFGKNDVRGLRMWTDVSGRYRLEARLLSVEDGVVRLATNDGRVFRIAAAKLSVVDRQWIRGQTRSLAAAW